MWISDQINWIISKRVKPIFFKIRSNQSIYHDKSNDIKSSFYVCRPFKHDGLRSAVRGAFHCTIALLYKERRMYIDAFTFRLTKGFVMLGFKV